VRASGLDVSNGSRYVSFRVKVGTAASLIAAVILRDPEQKAPTKIATCRQIVT